MKWLKKLVGDFAGVAAPADETPPAPKAPTAPPVAAAVIKPAAPVVPVVTQAARPTPLPTGSVQDFEKAREDFFAALKSDDSAAIERIAASYPGEALAWRTDEGTPLFIAQKANSLQSFKALLALGVDKEEKYPDGDFPLHYAQVNKQKDFFDYLLEQGADIERTFSVSSLLGASFETTTFTALATAIQKADKDAAITLMERGAATQAPYTYTRASLMSVGGHTPTPRLSSAVDFATAERQFLIADIAKRAHILRSDYLIRTATPAPVAQPEPVETAEDIGVMQPLRLKKTPDMGA